MLTLLALVVQVLSLTVLPVAQLGGPDAVAASVPEFWRAATDAGTQGFGGWYVVIFSYPLAALGILLALVSVLESVALKIVWGGLVVVGLGALVLKYGLGPFAELAGSDGGLSYSTQEITIATIAVGALVVVIFLLRTAMSTFRRVAGVILLGLAGVHVAAVSDLVGASPAEQLSVGAYGPALGYVLTAVAAFIGPRRLAGL